MDQLLIAIINNINSLIFDISAFLGIHPWHLHLFLIVISFFSFIISLSYCLEHKDIDFFLNLLEDLEWEINYYKSFFFEPDWEMEELIKKQEEEKYDLLLKFNSNTDFTMDLKSLILQLISERDDVEKEMLELRASEENILKEIKKIKNKISDYNNEIIVLKLILKTGEDFNSDQELLNELLNELIFVKLGRVISDKFLAEKELLKCESYHDDMSRLVILKNQKNLILFRFYEKFLRKKCAKVFGFEAIFDVKKVIKKIIKNIKNIKRKIKDLLKKKKW